MACKISANVHKTLDENGSSKIVNNDNLLKKIWNKLSFNNNRDEKPNLNIFQSEMQEKDFQNLQKKLIEWSRWHPANPRGFYGESATQWSDTVYGYIHEMLDKYRFVNGHQEQNPNAKMWWDIFGKVDTWSVYSSFMRTNSERHHSYGIERNNAFMIELERYRKEIFEDNSQFEDNHMSEYDKETVKKELEDFELFLRGTKRNASRGKTSLKAIEWEDNMIQYLDNMLEKNSFVNIDVDNPKAMFWWHIKQNIVSGEWTLYSNEVEKKKKRYPLSPYENTTILLNEIKQYKETFFEEER